MHRIRQILIAALCAGLLLTASPAAFAAPGPPGSTARCPGHNVGFSAWIQELISSLFPGSLSSRNTDGSPSAAALGAASLATTSEAAASDGTNLTTTSTSPPTNQAAQNDPDG